jgi:alpha-glucosidase
MPSWFAAEAEGWDPVADPASVVTVGRARFTLLTARLVRMEWAEDGAFEDRASLAFVNRRLPVPPFERRETGDWTELRTGALHLRFRETGEGFAPRNLELSIRGGGVELEWRPGDPATGNLGGTLRTLDATDGAQPLGHGVLSRDGWALVDDSAGPLFGGSGTLEVVPRPGGIRQDWYLFAHGRDYPDALGDLAAVTGRLPMPPRWAFGVWWSRYWDYSHRELQALVEDFHRHEVPLDVLVVDMDWHQTFGLVWGSGVKDAAGQPKGWTGYTWNRASFPDPEGFLAWAHKEGLRVPLNLHPASGIQVWETQYVAVAKALGMDPRRGDWIPFRAEDPDFAAAYFANVIHPLEGQGVDFWWLDWQQWDHTAIPGLTPTMWLGHLFFTDMESRRRERPIILHRYGGLGGHRYPVGFSGDAASTWESLAFQPELTATAGNVLFGYWSHDIGGHEPGPVAPELYTRWLQFGVFSPILRTHATKHPSAERRIWAFEAPYAEAMHAALELRMALMPYIYTAAREAFDTGVSLLRPMYYAWPEEEHAYACPEQYMFGPDLLVNPVTVPVDPEDGRAHTRTWLPPGGWVSWQTGEVMEGGRTVERGWGLGELPVFVRAGAIVPMAPPALRTAATASGPLVLAVFPGADGQARLYEDAGDDLGYRNNVCAWTPLRSTWDQEGRALTLRVGPTEGAHPGMPGTREVMVRLPGVWRLRNAEPPEATAAVMGDPPHTLVRLGAHDLRAGLVARLPLSVPTTRPSSG